MSDVLPLLIITHSPYKWLWEVGASAEMLGATSARELVGVKACPVPLLSFLHRKHPSGFLPNKPFTLTFRTSENPFVGEACCSDFWNMHTARDEPFLFLFSSFSSLSSFFFGRDGDKLSSVI